MMLQAVAQSPWAGVWTRWELAPGIVLPLVISAALYAVGVRRLWRRAGRGHGVRDWQVACFWSGWVVTALSLVSPLHEISEQLFSAHMVQHELLMVVAAPLLVLGRPLVPMLWALPIRARRGVGGWGRARPIRASWRWITAPLAAWCIHAAAIWIWHAPALFEATLTSDFVHSLQHASFLGSALLFWWALFHGSRGRLGYGSAVMYVFTTAVHTGALGALLTFSRLLWYPAYGNAAAIWGMTPLEDQQLAGLIMWIPASLTYLAACLWLLAAWMNESERRVVRQEQAAALSAGALP